MTQYLLQGEDVSALLHEVTGEGMAQRVTGLPFGQFNARPNQGTTKRADRARKWPVALPVILDETLQGSPDRNRANAAGFGLAVRYRSIAQPRWG